MNKLIFLFIILLNASQLHAQNITLTEIEKQVKNIRTQFQKINASPLNKKAFNWSQDGCGQGELTFYFINQQLVKIIETGSIGDGSWTKEYYYKDKKIVFTYEIEYIYVGNTETKNEYRTYFYNNKIIRSIENSVIKNYTQQVSVIYQTSKEYRLFNSFTLKNYNDAICQ